MPSDESVSDTERCSTCGSFPEDPHESDCPSAFVPGDDDTERTECWNCGYQRPIFEACPECGRFGGESA